MLPCQQKYRLVPAGEGKFHVEKKFFFYWAPLVIHDIHIGHGGDIIGLLKFSKEDGEKLIRVLSWIKYNDSVIHWRFLDVLKRKFDIEYWYNDITYD